MTQPLTNDEVRAGPVSRLFTDLMRRWAGIHMGPDGVQVEPHQLHRHRKLIHRLIKRGHKVVVRNGTGRRLTILRVTDLDPFPPPDESDLKENDFAGPVPDSSWLD